MKSLDYRVLHGGPLPDFVNAYGWTPSRVCKTRQRRFNLASVHVNGASTRLQAIVLRHLLNLSAELRRDDKPIVIIPTSSFRTCKEQRAICLDICGHESCPGLCAKPGTSAHQMGAAFDWRMKHPGMGVEQAYEQVYHQARRFDFFNFDGGWHGSDPFHFSFREAH